MTRRGAIVLLALSLAAAPAAAQMVPVEGRWRVLIHPHEAGAEALRAELRLADSAGTLQGTLRLESDSGAPVPLSRIRRPAADSLELERIAQGPLLLTGRWNGIAWTGEVGRAGRSLGRWEAVALDEGEEFYPALPAFVLRQVLLGSPPRGVTVPGPWIGAARARLVPDAAPAPDAERWFLGLEDRGAFRDSLIATLARLRGGLAGASLARFDGLFEPGRGWIADLHDAALRAARRGRPAAAWNDWAGPLVASGLAAPGADEAALMEAAWRLWSLGRSDTAAFRLRLEAVSASGAGVGGLPLLLQAYGQAAAWHAEATAVLAGLLDPAGGTAAVAPTSFGAPGALADGVLDSAVAAELVRPANWEGERWIARHGVGGLARAMARLEPEYGEAASVDLGQGRISLTTPAAEIRAGRFGLGRVVRYEPGEAPLLAAIRVVMERERARMLAAWHRRPGLPSGGATRFVPDPEPHLVAGLAEYAADLAAAGHPFLVRANAVRRAATAARDGTAPAILGLALVGALADALRLSTIGEGRAAVVALGHDWTGVMARPSLARAWSGWRDTPPAELPAGRGPVLIPELRFAVEGGEPLVAGIRVQAFE